MSKTIIIRSMRGAEMEATASVWKPRGWLYLTFGKNSKVCVDLATGEIVKGQSHCAPVFAPGELERVRRMFR